MFVGSGVPPRARLLRKSPALGRRLTAPKGSPLTNNILLSQLNECHQYFEKTNKINKSLIEGYDPLSIESIFFSLIHFAFVIPSSC